MTTKADRDAALSRFKAADGAYWALTEMQQEIARRVKCAERNLAAALADFERIDATVAA